MKPTIRERLYKKYPLSLAEGIIGGVMGISMVLSVRLIQPTGNLNPNWVYYITAGIMIAVNLWIFVRQLQFQKGEYYITKHSQRNCRRLKWMLWIPVVLLVLGFFLEQRARFLVVLISLWFMLFMKTMVWDYIVYFSKDGYFLMYDKMDFEGIKIQEIRRITGSDIYQFRVLKEKEVIGWSSFHQEDYDYLLTKVRKWKK